MTPEERAQDVCRQARWTIPPWVYDLIVSAIRDGAKEALGACMHVWVILDDNDYPIAVRESEQDMLAAVEQIAKRAIRNNPDCSPDEADTIRLTTKIDGDFARTTIYLAERQDTIGLDTTYMYIDARRFDTAAPIADR